MGWLGGAGVNAVALRHFGSLDEIPTSVYVAVAFVVLLLGHTQRRFWGRRWRRLYFSNVALISFVQLIVQRRFGIALGRRATLFAFLSWAVSLAVYLRLLDTSSQPHNPQPHKAQSPRLRKANRTTAHTSDDDSSSNDSDSSKPRRRHHKQPRHHHHHHHHSRSFHQLSLPVPPTPPPTQNTIVDEDESTNQSSLARRILSLPSRLNVPTTTTTTKDKTDDETNNSAPDTPAPFVVANELSISLEEKIASGDLTDESIARGLLALCFFRKNAGRSLFEAVMSLIQTPQRRELQRGQVLFREGDASDSLLIVHKGSLALVQTPSKPTQDSTKNTNTTTTTTGTHNTNTDGYTELMDVSDLECLGVLGVGDSYGDLETVDTSLTRAITCVALTRAEVWVIPHSIFAEIWTNHPHVLFAYIQGSLGHLYRIASVVLDDFFHLQLPNPPTPHVDKEIVESLSAPLELANTVPQTQCAKTVSASEILFNIGQNCNQLFLVVSGSVLCFEANGDQTVHQVGDIIASTAFLASVPHRTKAIGGPEGATVLVLEKPDILRLCTKRPKCVASLLEASIGELSGKIHLFAALGLQRVWCRAASSLFKKGQAVSHLFIVTCGRVRILHESDAQQSGSFSLRRRQMQDNNMWTVTKGIEIDPDRPTEVGRGGTIGDVSMFLDHAVHENSAVCIRETEVVRISKPVFQLICKTYPGAMLKFSRVMARQLCSAALVQSSQALGKTNRKTFCLFPVPGLPEDDIARFGAYLKDSLSEFGSTKLIDRSTINQVLSSADEGSHRPSAPVSYISLENFVELARLRAWLSHMEQLHGFVLLLADAHVSAWTRVCIENADLILLVASPTGLSSVGMIEQTLMWQDERDQGKSSRLWRVEKELVLLHRQRTTVPLPTGTRDWLNARPSVHRHHHIRRDVRADYGRLARHLTGKTVGLVFGGGGSRGLAHLGVLRALEDANIPIDFIGGTSQGALIGAIYAMCLSAKITEERVELQSFSLGNFRNLSRDFTLPSFSLFNGQKFSWLVRHTLGRDTQIEDLWLGFFCICTNVSTVEEKICERGNLWESVRASMTIVGLVPPMYSKEGLLVDGGYVDNLPAEHMRSLIGPGLCIAADVEDKDNSAFENTTTVYNDGVMSSASIVTARILSAVFGVPCAALRMRNPFQFHFPSRSQMIDNLTFLTHQVQFRRSIKCVDYYLRPPIQGYNLLDYDMINDISRLGYQYTVLEVKRWCDQAKRYCEETARKNRPVSQHQQSRQSDSLLFFRSSEASASESEQIQPFGGVDRVHQPHMGGSALVDILLYFRDEARNLANTDPRAPVYSVEFRTPQPVVRHQRTS